LSGSKPNSCLSLTPRFLIYKNRKTLNSLSVSDHKYSRKYLQVRYQFSVIQRTFCFSFRNNNVVLQPYRFTTILKFFLFQPLVSFWECKGNCCFLTLQEVSKYFLFFFRLPLPFELLPKGLQR
jgi:hypothetical protein